MTPCHPTNLQVLLEPDNLQLDVVVFRFATMLASLLNCPMLNKLENLVVNLADCYDLYQSPMSDDTPNQLIHAPMEEVEY
jgi:hypothetical protein